MSKFDKDKEVWIDYLEDELDPSLKEDLTLMVTHNPDALDTLKDYQEIRGALESVGRSVEIPKDEAYYENLHSRIMAQVKQTDVQSPVVVQLFQKKVYRAVAGFAIVLIAGMGIWKFTGPAATGKAPGDVEVANSSQWFLDSTARNPEVLPQTVITHEGQDELFLDATVEKLDNMPEDKAREIFNKLAD